QHRGAHGYPAGERFARRDRVGRAARGSDLRCHLERRHERYRRAGSGDSDYSGTRAPGTGTEGRILMQAFAYANPTTLQDALALLGTKWGDADVLAGGTDLLTLMKEYLHRPVRVVNIKNIKELDGITKTAEGLRIGALVTLDELATNADVKASYKAIAD